MHAHPTSRPDPLAHLRLSRYRLRHALGPPAAPATLTFTRHGLTVTTPDGSAHITPDTMPVAPAGILTAGLRPCDADVLRHFADGPDTLIDLTLDTLSLILTDPATDPATTATVGRW